MKVLILGIDGYLGWPLAVRLKKQGYDVAGCDNGLRRSLVKMCKSDSAVNIPPIESRIDYMNSIGMPIKYYHGDLSVNDLFAEKIIKNEKPDAIVHLAEIPSAPFSMISNQMCNITHVNNVLGTLNVLFAMRDHAPNAHLVKIGTLGELGTPNIDIPEGKFNVKINGRVDQLNFPKCPSSFYHATKCHDSVNIEMACRIWGLKSTDIMQGVVFGVLAEDNINNEHLFTRFDFDSNFGTCINRFVSQALIDMPLTVYGTGGQRRGFIPLKDSMQCLNILIDCPPEDGEYRVVNQFENAYTINGLAELVKESGRQVGKDVEISHIENPRVESEAHYYNPDRSKLIDLGYIPTLDTLGEITQMMIDLMPFKDRIEKYKEAIMPQAKWQGG